LAGLGRKEFNSGDILLASEVQGYLQDQAVMVFDDDTARGSAIASPTEGMLTYNKDTDQLELYDGSAFVGVGSDSGLIHIKTVSFSGVAEQILENVFTSEYKNYLMRVNISAVASGDVELRLFFRDATPADVTTNLNRERLTQRSSTITGSQGGNNLFGQSGSSNPTFSNYNVNIYNPNLARRTTYVSDGGFVNNIGEPIQERVFGYNNSNTVMTGIKIFPSASNFTGEVSIFGYKD
jgi:hypothetical protein